MVNLVEESKDCVINFIKKRDAVMFLILLANFLTTHERNISCNIHLDV